MAWVPAFVESEVSPGDGGGAAGGGGSVFFAGGATWAGAGVGAVSRAGLAAACGMMSLAGAGLLCTGLDELTGMVFEMRCGMCLIVCGFAAEPVADRADGNSTIRASIGGGGGVMAGVRFVKYMLIAPNVIIHNRNAGSNVHQMIRDGGRDARSIMRHRYQKMCSTRRSRLQHGANDNPLRRFVVGGDDNVLVRSGQQRFEGGG